MRFAAALILVATAMAQRPGAVEGVVTDAVTGAPVKKALVTLRSTGRNEGYQALSDATGKFRIEGVKPGEYGLWAQAQGFDLQPARYLKPAVTVEEDKTAKDCAIRLHPLSRITGRVTDEFGEPVANAQVAALTYSYSHTGSSAIAQTVAITNDRGEYRLFDLASAPYYLRVSKKSPAPEVTGRGHRDPVEMEYGYTYYPGVRREAEAAPLVVAEGAEVSEIVIRIQRERVFRVHGKVIDSRTSQGVAKADIWTHDVGHVESREDGVFDIRGLAPGTYRVAAGIKSDGWLFSPAREVVITDHDVSDLVLRLEPALTVTGTILVEDGPREAAKQVRLSLEPVDGITGIEKAKVQDDGRFSIDNLVPQKYRLRLEDQPNGTYLKSVRCGDRDSTDDGLVDVAPGVGITLVFGRDGGRVEGKVQTGASKANMLATMAPAARLAGRLDLVHTSATNEGSFRFENVAPGDYKLFVWEVEDRGVAEYAGFRALLESRAVSVTVRPRETNSVTPDAIPAAEVQAARRKLR
jgi:hypothetical protein